MWSLDSICEELKTIDFFTEWQTELLDLSPSEAAAIEIVRRQLRSEMITGVSVSLHN